MTRGGGIALGGVAAALIVLIFGEWVQGEARLARIEAPTPVAREAQERSPEAGETGAAPSAIDLWLRTALARPLMSSGRRPAPSTTDSGVSLTNGLPRLAGTLFGGSGSGIAIFARDDSGHAVVMREGGSMGPYRVTRIAPNSVTLDGPSGVQTLHPRFGEAKTAGGPYTPMMPPPMNLPGMVQPMPGVMQPQPLQPDPQDQ